MSFYTDELRRLFVGRQRAYHQTILPQENAIDRMNSLIVIILWSWRNPTKNFAYDIHAICAEPEIERLSQFFFIFLCYDMIVLIFGFIEVALRTDRLRIGAFSNLRTLALHISP